MYKVLKRIDWGTVAWEASVPFVLLYDITLGQFVGWLQSTFLTGPDWNWYGPIPIHKRFDRWDRTNA